MSFCDYRNLIRCNFLDLANLVSLQNVELSNVFKGFFSVSRSLLFNDSLSLVFGLSHDGLSDHSLRGGNLEDFCLLQILNLICQFVEAFHHLLKYSINNLVTVAVILVGILNVLEVCL